MFEGMQIHVDIVRKNVQSSDAILERALMMLTCHEKSQGRQTEHERIRRKVMARPAGQGLDDSLLEEFPEVIYEI